VSDRGPGLRFSTTVIDIAADMANGLIQEFVLRKLTPFSHKPTSLIGGRQLKNTSGWKLFSPST
jgi:hypothetical protein